jgi:hypothetical protein
MPRENPRTTKARDATNQGVGEKRMKKSSFLLSRAGKTAQGEGNRKRDHSERKQGVIQEFSAQKSDDSEKILSFIEATLILWRP